MSIPSFSLLEPLGRGATATVFKARRDADGRLFALKRLDLADEAARVMFRHELWSMQRLAHPNLVAVHAASPDAFVMDLVDGPGVPDGPLDAEGLRAVLVPAARALGYLHGRGLVHGDVKAENLRFDGAGVLRLLDLGFLQRAGSPGLRRGTPGYMGPEVLRGEPADPRGDLYALGAMAYLLLAGHLPFEPGPGGPVALLRAQLEGTPPSLAELRPDLPRPLADAVMACLARDLADRPPTASHLLARLGWGEAEASFAGFGATLVGRGPELAAAHEQLGRQWAGEAAALRVDGAPGAGRSRFLAALAAPPQPALLAVADEVPYGLVTGLLQAADGLLAERGLLAGDARWQALRELMPAWGEAPAALEPRAREARLRQALMTLLSALAGAEGLVVALDDWGAADPASRSLLEGLLLRPSGERVAWVVAEPALAPGEAPSVEAGPGAMEAEPPAADPSSFRGARPEDDAHPSSSPTVAGGASADALFTGGKLVLRPLDARAAGEAIASALGEPHVPDDLAALALERSGGLPGRLRDVLAAWIAAGAVTPRHGRWAFDLDRAAAVPLSLDDPAAARLAGLGPDVRRVAAAAAVLGPAFSLPALAHVAGGEIFDAVAALEAAGLVAGDGETYRFAGNTRGAALAGDVAPLHARALALYREREDLAGLTLAARHALGAASADRGQRGLAAARANLAQGSLGTARELLEALAGIELSTEDAEERERLAGDVLRTGGDGAAALARYEGAIALARELNAPDRLGRELVSAGRTAMMLSRGDDARAWLAEGLDLCRAAGLRAQEARALMTLGRVDFFGGRAAEGRAGYEAAAKLAREAGEEGLLADALAFLGGTAPPNDPQGRAWLAEALAAHRRAQNPLGVIEGSIALGDRLLAAGALADARAAFEEALATCRQVGSSNEETFARLNLAQTALDAGDANEALAQADAAHALAAELKQPFPAGFGRVLSAQARARLGDYARAEADARDAVETATRIGVPYLGAAAQLATAYVALEVGDAEAARAALDAGLEAERALGDPVGEARATMLLGRLALLENEPEMAERLLEKALDAAREHGARLLEAQTQQLLADLAARRNRDSAAAYHAISIALELGAREVEAWARWRAGGEEFLQTSLDLATAGGLRRLEALACLALAEERGRNVAPHDPGARAATVGELRARGQKLLRELAHAAGRERFERWPENRVQAVAPAAGRAVPGLAEALAMVDEVRHADSVNDLASRLLERLMDLVGAQAGALLVYRDLQIQGVATAFVAEADVIDQPVVSAAAWDREPAFEGGRWALPVVEDDVLLAIAYLEDADPAAQPLMPPLAEALRLALGQFLRWQAFQLQVERLALSEALARLAVEGEDDRTIVREALAAALRVTGAERALLVRSGATLELALGVDAQGRELPPDAAFSQTVCRWVASTRETVRLVDPQQMEGWQQAQSILALGLRTLVAVPLVARERMLGVLYVDSTDLLHLLGEREQGLLETAARVIAPLAARWSRP